MRPKRIQLKRSKGWKMPPDTVKVDRSTKWGNQFIVNPHVKPGSKSGALYICVPTLEDAVETFREFMLQRPELIEKAKAELRGKDLACWCKEGPCHADVLLEIANS